MRRGGGEMGGEGWKDMVGDGRKIEGANWVAESLIVLV